MEKVIINLNGSNIEVDKRMSKIIIMLNEKGYKTLFSCSGHYYEDNTFEQIIKKEDISRDELIKWIENNKLTFLKEDCNNYYIKNKNLGESCYILFEDETELPFLPESFVVSNNTIRYIIPFYKDELGLLKRDKKEIIEDIEKANMILEKWVNMLPSYNIKKSFKK